MAVSNPRTRCRVTRPGPPLSSIRSIPCSPKHNQLVNLPCQSRALTLSMASHSSHLRWVKSRKLRLSISCQWRDLVSNPRIWMGPLVKKRCLAWRPTAQRKDRTQTPWRTFKDRTRNTPKEGVTSRRSLESRETLNSCSLPLPSSQMQVSSPRSSWQPQRSQIKWSPCKASQNKSPICLSNNLLKTSRNNS